MYWWKRKYPDYEDNEYNCGALKHIWGVTSWGNLLGIDAHLYSMNDIDITYDRDEKKYCLGIETAYLFDDNKAECNYLRKLLEEFSVYMDSNGLNKDIKLSLFMGNPRTSTSAKSIEELYVNFKIFVEGYCKSCGY